LPGLRQIDGPLFLHAAVFGIGWRRGVFLPGPSLATPAAGSLAVILFVAVMIAGQWLTGVQKN